MTTKVTPTADSTGSLSLAQLPPQISLASPLLVSIIRLPPDPLIAYTIFEPSDALDQSLHLSAIESARRSLVSDSRSILKSLLFTVKILPFPLLYVFAISSSGERSPSHDTLLELKFDGLVSSKSSAFPLKGLYPCSAACSDADDPCPNCLTLPLDPLDPPFVPRPLAQQFPRSPLRAVYAQLLHSIREFVSDRLGSVPNSPDLLPTLRCRDGVILTGMAGLSDWGTGWAHWSRNRKIIFCHFEVYFSHFCLLLHPILRPVEMLPLACSIPISPGSPVKLLPFGTPAYYLGPYAGPTNSLTTQFEDSLRGLGVDGWKNSVYKPPGKHLEGPSYVIVWVAVQNRRGEEKGISVVWPLSLCLAFLPESLQASHGLPSLPELPTSLRLHSSIPPPSSTAASAPQIPPQDAKSPLGTIPTIPPVDLPPRVAVYSARSLLSLSTRVENTVDGVSQEVNGFVDYVAKERERERERIKRERDNHSNPISASQPVATHRNDSERERTPSPPLVAGLMLSDNQESNESPLAETCEPLNNSDANPEGSAQGTAPSGKSPDAAGPYEIYPNFNSSWAQDANEFPALEIDYEMGFGMEMNAMDRDTGVGGETGITTDLDDIYGVFTDDDFNFFDRPTLDEGYPEQVRSTILLRDPLVPHHGVVPPVAVHTSPTNGVALYHDHIATLPHPASPPISLWTPTPRVDPLAATDSAEPVSPSISSQSAPSTPQAIPDLRTPSSTCGSSVFDPVWFSPTHRTTDRKYASGKFSLPDRRAVRVPDAPVHNTGWRPRYDDATDPRKSVVRRLTAPSSSVDSIDARGEIVENEWGNLSEEESENWSDMESIDERSVEWADEADTDISVLLERPCTPPPQFTPLGPLLLDCQFHHGYLVPLSVPLHSTPSAMAATNLQNAVPTISVPTPVSPPAMLGEKLKSWEAAAGLLVREIVENPLWAESWQISNHHSSRASSSTWSTCQGDVSQLATALDTLDDSNTSLEMGTIFDLAAGSLQPYQGDASSSLQSIEPPLLSVGKGNSIINISPSGIRFWEKAGLQPLGGQKNVNAFVLYEGEGADMFEHASRWFKRVSIAYASKNFGCHEPGRFKDGSSSASVVEVRFDSIRRFLSTFTSKIEASEYLVFYVVTPLSMMTLASSNFRQVLSAAKRALKGSVATSTLFQFVPEPMVADPVNEDQGTMSSFVTSVYDRLLKSVRRGMPRPLFDQEGSARVLVQSSAFTLSRPQHPRPVFLRQTPARSLDVMDRHLLLHVGYGMSSCGKWVMASCIDQRGGGHDLGLWLNQPDDELPEEFMITKVWEFAMSFTRRADVEWRVAFAKAGSIDEREMEAWHSKVSLGISIRGASPIHVSIISAALDAPWTLLSPTASSRGFSGSAKAAPSMRFQDASSTTYALIHTTPVTLFSPLLTNSFVVTENAVPEPDEVVAPGIGIRPLSTATLIRVPAGTDYSSVSMLRVHLLLTLKAAGSHLYTSDEDTHLDIIHNFHELTVLGDARWNLGAKANPILPFHLGCLEVMDRVLVGEVQVD